MNLIRTLLLFIFLIISTNIYSQLKIGIKGGINFSSSKFEESSYDPEIKIGYHAGLLFRYKINDKLFLKPELLYSLKGWGIPDDNLNKDVSITLKYLNIPLLLEYHILEKFSLLLGPELGYKLDAERKPYGPGWVDIYDDIDIGIIVGTNYNVSQSLALGIRYIQGFKGLIKGTDQNGDKISIGNNKVLSIGLSYLF